MSAGSEDRSRLREELIAHQEYLRRVARGLLADQFAADDLVQETLLRSMEHPPALDRPIRPWLKAVLRSRLKDRVRREGRRAQREASSSRADHEASAADEAARQDVCHALLQAVRSLREPYRTIIRMRFEEELETAEIARRQGLPLETIRTQIKRGLAHLREHLDRGHGGRPEAWIGAITAFLTLGLLPRRPKGIRWAGFATATTAALVGVTILYVLISRRDQGPLPVAEPTIAAASQPSPELAPPGAADISRAAAVLEPETGWLRVSVVFEHSRQPVADAHLSVRSSTGFVAQQSTGPDGQTILSLPVDQALELEVAESDRNLSASIPLAETWASDPSTGVTIPVRAVCEVRGTAVHAEHGAMKGVLVRAIDGTFPHFYDGSPPRVLAETTTDASGGFALSRVPVDAAIMVTDGTGSIFGLHGPPELTSGNDSSWRLSRPREPHDFLDSGDPVFIRYHDVVPFRVTVRGADGMPIEGARLELQGTGFTYRLGTSDAEGHHTFGNLVSARMLTLSVSAAGHAPQIHGPFQLRPAVSEYTVELGPELAIEGRVLSREGAPLVGAKVMARPELSNGSPDPLQPGTVLPIATRLQAARGPVEVDESGAFRITGVGASPYVLEARLSGHLVCRGIARGGETGVELRTSSSEACEVRFFGSVTDAQTGHPIDGFRVVIEEEAGESHEVRGGASGFDLCALSPGRWILLVAAEGYAPFSTVPRSYGPGRHRIDVPLQPSRVLRLRIEDVHGTPGASMWAVATRQSPYDRGPTAESGFAGAVGRADGDGVILLRDVPAGRFDLLVWPRFSCIASQFTMDLSEPPEETVELHLDLDWTTPRREVRLALVEQGTEREISYAGVDDLDLNAFDDAGNRLLTVVWRKSWPIDWSRLEVLRFPSGAGAAVTIERSAPPTPWWWLGPTPLFFNADRVIMPTFPLPVGRVRLRVESPGFEPLEQEFEIPGDPAPVALRLVLAPVSTTGR